MPRSGRFCDLVEERKDGARISCWYVDEHSVNAELSQPVDDLTDAGPNLLKHDDLEVGEVSSGVTPRRM